MGMPPLSTGCDNLCGTVFARRVQQPCQANTSIHGVDNLTLSTDDTLESPTTGEGDYRGWGYQTVTASQEAGSHQVDLHKTGEHGQEQDEYWMWLR